MTTWAIGDLQGCLQPLQRLLDRLRFDPAADRLWFAGDLVNRGADSLGCLRLVRDLGEAAICVLGNHDLHLLAVAAGTAPLRAGDTLQAVLDAPDRDALLAWLRHRPLLHHDAALGYTLAHAGLAPDWDLPTARACAAEVEAALRGPDPAAFLRAMYGNTPDRWSPALAGIERRRYAVNALTRMRYIAADGRLLFQPKGPPGSQPPGAHPWFQSPRRAHAGQRIVFGHWSSLGRVHWPEEEVWCLDTGCLWGHRLTALALETGELRHCECRSGDSILNSDR